MYCKSGMAINLKKTYVFFSMPRWSRGARKALIQYEPSCVTLCSTSMKMGDHEEKGIVVNKTHQIRRILILLLFYKSFCLQLVLFSFIIKIQNLILSVISVPVRSAFRHFLGELYAKSSVQVDASGYQNKPVWKPHLLFPVALHLPHFLFPATLLNDSTMFALRGVSGSGGPKTDCYWKMHT